MANKRFREKAGMAEPRRGSKEMLNLWKSRGTEDVYYQRESQVNLWTVMGGLAAAALLTQLSALVQEVQASRWYLVLYFLASIAIIVNSWTQTSWGSLVLRWPISIPLTLFIFLTQFSLAIQCLQVTSPLGWMGTTGLVILFVLLNQIYTRISGAWALFSPKRLEEIKAGLWVYVVWLMMCAGAAAQLYWFPSRLSEIIWGFVALSSTVIALVMQHRGMKRERKELGIP